MDWKLLGSTFALIFLAELGDKTQLTALAASAGARSPWSVFAGASAALVFATLIATLFGSTLQRFLPAHYLKGGAAVLFFVFGIFLLISAIRSKEAVASPALPAAKPGVLSHIILGVAREFEESSALDYEKLAAAQDNKTLKNLFRHLAREERQHLDTIGQLSRAHAEKVSADVAAKAQPVPAILEEEASAAHDAVEKALAHEKATEQFYRELAAQAILPAVRKALSALAAEEAGHVKHLEQFIATGTFVDACG